MSTFGKFLMVAALVTISACTDAGRFGGFGDGSSGSAGVVPGSANDPTSPAYFSQTIGDRVLFPVDQSTLSAEAQLVLEGQAQWLLANTDYSAVIEGHADQQIEGIRFNGSQGGRDLLEKGNRTVSDANDMVSSAQASI